MRVLSLSVLLYLLSVRLCLCCLCPSFGVFSCESCQIPTLKSIHLEQGIVDVPDTVADEVFGSCVSIEENAIGGYPSVKLKWMEAPNGRQGSGDGHDRVPLSRAVTVMATARW